MRERQNQERKVLNGDAEAHASDRQYGKFREDKDGKLGLVFDEYASLMDFLTAALAHLETLNIDYSKYNSAIVTLSHHSVSLEFSLFNSSGTIYSNFSKEFRFDVRKYAWYIDILFSSISERVYLFSDVLKEIGGADRDTSALPDVPPALWQGARSLNLPFHQAVVLFLRAVYGPYAAGHKDKLRAYIFNKDKKLYRAIQDYERGGRDLPEDIAMPSEREKLRVSMDLAKESGLESLSERDLVAVARKMARQRQPKP